jgi:hypothetical protein
VAIVSRGKVVWRGDAAYIRADTAAQRLSV